MAAGQRFELNLDSEDDKRELPLATAPLEFGFVKDITERDVSANGAPAPPQSTSSSTGFPEHRKRTRPSRFKQRQGSAPKSSAPADSQRSRQDLGVRQSAVRGTSFEEHTRQQANGDSQQALDGMSREDIEEQRKELLSGMVPGVTPSLIERLLKRANVNEDQSDPLEPPTRPGKEEGRRDNSIKKNGKVSRIELEAPRIEVTSDETQKLASAPKHTPLPPSHDSNVTPLHPPDDLRPATSKEPFPSRPPPSTHFPTPAQPPDLDPSSPTFLSDLQKHYFPNLSLDPSTLSWMSPVAPPSTSTYSSTATSFTPSELRFDFKGRLLPPNLSHQIPSHLGLHHHGAAPEAAGYTVRELAHMSRSVMPPQRCVAYQTLGRILYRLGKGTFGPEGDDLYEGLWRCVEEGRVLDTLMAEGGREGGEGGSRSAWAVATEALWNWRMGGGKRWEAG
ncbi:MAG: hypothetical protein MMC23_006583 [Stictis urceolatum]|nr:hypothetical protein [Stictis urceolata]